jgi:hypothetical protein
LQVVGMDALRNLREGGIPESGCWIMEENPTATISMAQTFLDANIAALKPSYLGQAVDINRGARNAAQSTDVAATIPAFARTPHPGSSFDGLVSGISDHKPPNQMRWRAFCSERVALGTSERRVSEGQ